MGQLLRVGLLTLAAAVVAVCGTFVHLSIARPAGLAVPYGLMLALLGVAALVILAQAAARSRIGKGVIAAGWLLPVIVLTQTTGAGDVVIVGDIRGLSYLFGGVILLGVAIGLPNRPIANGGAEGRVG